MELKLNIYEGKEIIKTYTAETIDFSFGIIEDIMDVLDFENMKSKNDLALAVAKCTKQLKPFLMDMFAPVTSEEIRKTRIKNIIEIFKQIFDYAQQELGLAVGNSKN
jgi:hypothetical protein